MKPFNQKDAKLLWIQIQEWIKEHEPLCAESIYQSDRIAEYSLELVETVCNIVGYAEVDPDEE